MKISGSVECYDYSNIRAYSLYDTDDESSDDMESAIIGTIKTESHLGALYVNNQGGFCLHVGTQC